ncbi:hypothetical protein [Crateriforma conspicua]|uniref:hypothetical protein n=1 Tax=Crateriforma conspicua TaxID=2527996 RepID=UPI00118AF249|nr:hypothetical protein [Crateriforma conspicua]QDV63486.1 hypothetical protein Mal65_26290 [Crateriforma conspicua]
MAAPTKAARTSFDSKVHLFSESIIDVVVQAATISECIKEMHLKTILNHVEKQNYAVWAFMRIPRCRSEFNPSFE